MAVRWYSWNLARASVLIVVAMRWTSGSSKVAARPMACGNTVAMPWFATPWSASLHQLYAGTWRRGMAADVLLNCVAFSSTVMRETRSSTR